MNGAFLQDLQKNLPGFGDRWQVAKSREIRQNTFARRPARAGRQAYERFAPMPFPADYYERVYAGVLGKIIGVYLGRPFEGWSHAQIMEQLGEIHYYVNNRPELPLPNREIVVTDDDISGTFTFLRALPDYGNDASLTPAQIGQTWLNYIIENRTILWWGGLGNSTEHTAFLRLKDGIPAPRSGSQELNGRVVAEQIGAQIFIEGWGLVCPGDPQQASELARRAASVSHDGEAVYGAQVIAALVAQAFLETDLNRLLDTALALIPPTSTIARLIADLRSWHAAEPHDWRASRARLEERYGYEKFGGNCHIIPNHGLVILSLLYSQGDFSRAQTIVNTSGWDTDCNAANVGCILGVRNGLSAFEGGPDWRGPLADQLYLPTADGGRAISDALREADFIVQTAHALRGERPPTPKDGARFHFSLPGAVQGFRPQGRLTLENIPAPDNAEERVLALRYQLQAGETARAGTPTFIPPAAIQMPGYDLLASPTLYPGQTLRAAVSAASDNLAAIRVALRLQVYGKNDQLEEMEATGVRLAPGASTRLTWQVPDLQGAPCALAGLSVSTDQPTTGTLHLHSLTWDGTPQVTFTRPPHPGQMWARQWVNAADYCETGFAESLRIIQNRGRGLISTGAREWSDYSVEALITPHLAQAFGLGARVQGQERYYALLLSAQKTVRLIRRLDGETLLAEQPLEWQFGQPFTLRLEVSGARIQGWVNGNLVAAAQDQNCPLPGGGVALICEAGRIGVERVTIAPALPA